MPDYLVESYHSDDRPSPLPLPAADVRLVHSIVVPEDEVTLHVFAAPSSIDLRHTLERVAFAYDRIVEAVSRPADASQ